MKHTWAVIGVAAALALAAGTVTAQTGGPGGGMSANMNKFFAGNKTFSADVGSSMQSSQLPNPVSMDIKMFMLDGKTRVEMDMSKAKGLPPQQIAMMKKLGADKTITIERPDKKATYIIFPGMSAYAVMPMTDKEVKDAMDDSKLEKTSVGKETIDGHPCEKNKIASVGEDGTKQDATVWNATDMKGFPMKIQMEEAGNKMSMTFSNVKTAAPEAKLFDPPADYKKYDGIQELQMEMMKRMGAAGGPGGR